jgi:hypothetical protein
MNASATMAIPAQSLDIPPDDGITYATVDLDETIKVFAKYGVRFLSPDEIALELPAFPLCSRELRTKWSISLHEPFSPILDRDTADFDEPLDPNRSERDNNRNGSEFDDNRDVRTSDVGLCVEKRTH